MASTDKYPQYLDQPESRRLEFKESFPKGEQVARTAVAFANGAGGRLVFGVKDSPREFGVGSGLWRPPPPDRTDRTGQVSRSSISD